MSSQEAGSRSSVQVASNSTAAAGVVELVLKVEELHWEGVERREVEEVEDLHPQCSSSSPECARKIENQLVQSDKYNY